MAKKQRWVIKAGSNMVCSGGPLLLRAWAQQITKLNKKYNIEIIWVTSGAIATAKEKYQLIKKNQKISLNEKQALSAIGQPAIMELYNLAFHSEGLKAAQILLTYDDLAHAKRRSNFINTIDTLLKWGVVPILNENDAVATEEIKFGDNDSLSARVAKHVKANRLIILTDVNGLYDSNPTENADAQLISELNQISNKLLNNPSLKSGSSRGTGGMYSKLLAAQMAIKNKIQTHLLKGDLPDALIMLAQNKKVGTCVKVKKG